MLNPTSNFVYGNANHKNVDNISVHRLERKDEWKTSKGNVLFCSEQNK